MGVMGVALATIAAQFMAGVGCLICVIRTNPYFILSREECRPRTDMIKRAVRLGVPLALQWSMIAISATALQSFVNSFGTAAMAAFAATSRVEQLLHQPYGSLSTALSTYASQNYGARKLSRVKSGLRHGMVMSAVFSAVMVIVMQLFADRIIAMFVDDAEVIRIGAYGLRLTSYFYIFLATINMVRGMLNGVGDAMFSLINGGVEVVCRLGLPMVIVLIPGLGVDGIWWTVGLAWAISAMFCVFRYAYWQHSTRGAEDACADGAAQG